jgi:hypothetical protein
MRKIVLAIVVLTTMLFADKASDEVIILYNPNAAKPTPVNLDEELVGKPYGCLNFERVKELIAKGADINYINDKGYSAFTNFAMKAASSYSDSCKETAHYLSSIGAVDSGAYTALCYYASSKYDPPFVYENKHLKITLDEYSFHGSSWGILENKTDEPIYIYSYTNIVNGVKESFSWKTPENPNGWGVIKANSEKDNFGMYFSPKTNIKGKKYDYSKYPKIINNKLKLVMEYSITYSYKGKTYEFKLPVITQELDMTYEKC